MRPPIHTRSISTASAEIDALHGGHTLGKPIQNEDIELNAFHTLSVRARMQILAFLALCGLVILCLVSLMHLRDSMLEDRKQKTKNLVEVGVGIAAHFHKLSSDGKMDEAEAKNSALAALRGLRYANADYFFGIDSKHVYLLMPPRPEQEGQDKSDLKDANGKFLIRELVKAAQAGGGFVDYWFPKAGAQTAEPKLSYAALFAPWGWVLGTGIYIDDVDKEFRQGAIQLGSISLLLVAVLAILAWRISAGILNQLGGEPHYAAEVTRRIAAGDLRQPVSVDRELKQSLLGALDDMQRRLAALFFEINQAAHALSDNAASLSSTTAEISQATDAQATATAAAAASLEQVTVSINEVSALAAMTEKSSSRMASLADDGVKAIAVAVEEIESMAGSVSAAAEQVGGLVKRSEEVGGIANVIREIADQTNLLALNAAIEAARAGEQGRGFAVVADEVRKLAERTAKATTEIAKVIEQIQRETRQTVDVMQHVGPKVENGLKRVNAVAELLTGINHEATESRRHAIEVANATREQAIAANDIARNVEQVSQMTEETNATMHNNADSAAELQSMATELRSQVSYFKLS
jgi:methyl-accepting chemotaxis protein